MKNNLLVALIFAVFTTGCTSCLCAGLKKNPTKTVYLTEKNTVVYADMINTYSVDLVTAAIVAKRLFVPEQEPLYIVIGSYGGFYEQALILRFFLDRVPNLVLICYNCQSAAGLVFMTSAHPRYVVKNSTLMMHEMYNPHATAKFMSNPKLVESFVKSSDEFDRSIANVLKMKLKDYQKKVTDTSWVVRGKDIVKLGAADEVINVRCNAFIKTIAPLTCGEKDE